MKKYIPFKWNRKKGVEVAVFVANKTDFIGGKKVTKAKADFTWQ